jgi:DnaJ family protein A protein 2
MFFSGGAGMSPFGGNFDDNFFQNNKQTKKTDAKIVNIPITLKDIYCGSKKKITLKIKNLCNKCNGYGGLNIKNCSECNGNGVKIINKMLGPGMIQRIQIHCSTCNGNKKISETKCNTCNGDGKNIIEKNFLLTIEPGSNNNDEKIFKNEGDINLNEEQGDVVFILKEEKNNTYIRLGNDMIYYHNITLGDSIVGIDITINLINGEKLSYKENNMIQQNSYTIFKNKGFPIKNIDNSYGDLYIVYNVIYPNKLLSNNEKDVIKKILEVTVKSSELDTNIYNTSGILKNNFSTDDLKQKYEKNNNSHNIPHNIPHNIHMPHHMHNIFNRFF